MYTNITIMYKIYTKYQAAAAWPGPEARAKGRSERAGAGRHWYFVYITVYICIYYLVHIGIKLQLNLY